jgi:hypothetical protein
VKDRTSKSWLGRRPTLSGTKTAFSTSQFFSRATISCTKNTSRTGACPAVIETHARKQIPLFRNFQKILKILCCEQQSSNSKQPRLLAMSPSSPVIEMSRSWSLQSPYQYRVQFNGYGRESKTKVALLFERTINFYSIISSNSAPNFARVVTMAEDLLERKIFGAELLGMFN